MGRLLDKVLGTMTIESVPHPFHTLYMGFLFSFDNRFLYTCGFMRMMCRTYTVLALYELVQKPQSWFGPITHRISRLGDQPG